jgi:hypothetical protein
MKPGLTDCRADDWNLLEGVRQIIENKAGAVLQVKRNSGGGLAPSGADAAELAWFKDEREFPRFGRAKCQGGRQRSRIAYIDAGENAWRVELKFGVAGFRLG